MSDDGGAPADPAPRRRARPESLPHRDLVLLGDGPWRGRVYWADEFTTMQDAARRYPVTHPAGELAGYVPTRQTAPSAYNAAQTAAVWVFRPDRAQPARRPDTEGARPR